MNNDTRRFTARYLITLDTAVLSAHDHTITVTGHGDSIQFALDGNSATFERVEAIRKLAMNLGTFTRISGPSLDPIGIGNKAACTLHRDLARLGYSYSSSHLQIATDSLERPIASLAALTAADAQTIYGYACAQMGMDSRVWAV